MDFPVFPLKGLRRLSGRSAYDQNGSYALVADDVVVDQTGCVWTRPGKTRVDWTGGNPSNSPWLQVLTRKSITTDSGARDGALVGLQRDRRLSTISLIGDTNVVVSSNALVGIFPRVDDGYYFGMTQYAQGGSSEIYISAGTNDQIARASWNPMVAPYLTITSVVLPTDYTGQIMMAHGKTLFTARNVSFPRRIALSNGNDPMSSGSWTTSNMVEYQNLIGGVRAMLSFNTVAYIHGAFDVLRVTGFGPNLADYKILPMGTGVGALWPTGIDTWNGLQYFIGWDGFYEWDGQSVPVCISDEIAPLLRDMLRDSGNPRMENLFYKATGDWPQVLALRMFGGYATPTTETGMEGQVFVMFLVDLNNDSYNDTAFLYNLNNKTWVKWNLDTPCVALAPPILNCKAPWFYFERADPHRVYRGGLAATDDGVAITGKWASHFTHIDTPFFEKHLSSVGIAGTPAEVIPNMTVKTALDGVETWTALPGSPATVAKGRHYYKVPVKKSPVTVSVRVEVTGGNKPILQGYNLDYEPHPSQKDRGTVTS